MHIICVMADILGLLIDWRIIKFIREFDINIWDIDSFTDTKRERQWKILKQKLILHNYVTVKDDFRHCYVVINNIIWKNIINHKIKYNTDSAHYHLYSHMLYNNYHQTRRLVPKIPYFSKHNIPYFSKHNILNDTTMTRDNFVKMRDFIVIYLILIDNIVTTYMIPDLCNVIKKCMYNIIIMW